MNFVKKWVKEKEKLVNEMHELNKLLSSNESKSLLDEFEINRMFYKLSIMENYCDILDELIIYRNKITETHNSKQLKLF